MSSQKRGWPRRGRPPRTDNPVRVGFMMPGAMLKWLRARAAREGRTQTAVLESALTLYQKRVARREP